MKDGGVGEYIATQFKLMSLPVLMNISELPRIFAFETEIQELLDIWFDGTRGRI